MPIPKPSELKANNDMKTVDLFYHRSLYKSKSLVTEGNKNKLEAAITDIWESSGLYGKINDRGDFIIPRENLFGFLRTEDGSSRFALNFVADAYNEMLQKMQDDQIVGSAIPVESPFANFTVSKSWTSVYNKFHEYAQDIYAAANQHFYKPTISNKIKNFDDFVREFMNFYHYMKQGNMPFTLSGYVGSRLCASNSGALMIEISDAAYDNDEIKYNTFINDPGFNVFRSYASRYGFVIDRNAPWRLIANLNSTYMKNKMMNEHLVYYGEVAEIQKSSQKIVKEIENLKYGSQEYDEAKIEELQELLNSSINQRNIFDTYYYRTFELDMNFLKTYMFEMYNSYVAQISTYKKYVRCESGDKNIRVKKKRLALDESSKSDYNVRDFWIPLYFEIRKAETGANFSDTETKIILQNVKKIYNLHGELKTLEFLNNKLKKRHKHIYKNS